MRGISGLFTTWGVVGDRNAPGRPSGIGAGSMLAAARDAGWVVGDDVGVEYVSRVPGPPLDGLIDDLYYLEGAPPYSRLMLPAAPAPLLIVNLGAPFLIRAGTDVDAVEYADGCAVTTPTRAWEFSYPTPTRSVGVHFRPWGLAPFLPMPAAELCDRPATVEQLWRQPAIDQLRHRLTLPARPRLPLPLRRVGARRRSTDRLGRRCRWRGLLRPGPLRARVPGVHRAHADPVRRSPAAIPARSSRPRPERLAAPSRLISYKRDSSRRTRLGTPNRGGIHGERGHERVGFGGWFHRG